MSGPGRPHAEPTTEVSQIYSIEDVAAMLGVNPLTVYRHITDGKFPIPVRRFGRKIIISKPAFDRWLHGPD